MQGEGMSLSAEEKVRVAHALDGLGVHMIEAGFPASNPKEAELFERLAHESFRADVAAFGMTRRRDVAADRDPGPAGARRLLRPGLHPGRARLGAAPREGHPGLAARRTWR
jgi:isopropylmalate/homocitrate/citramalate synthase